MKALRHRPSLMHCDFCLTDKKTDPLQREVTGEGGWRGSGRRERKQIRGSRVIAFSGQRSLDSMPSLSR
jgi:hypothetical protein